MVDVFFALPQCHGRTFLAEDIPQNKQSFVC
jgi:hypothetical protein